METNIVGQAFLCYPDSFGLDVAAEITHWISTSCAHEFGYFDDEREKYSLAVQAAKTMVSSGKSVSLTFDIVDTSRVPEKEYLYVASIQYRPDLGSNGFMITLDNSSGDPYFGECFANPELAQQVIDLIYGAFLDSCKYYGHEPLALLEDQEQALQIYQSTPDFIGTIRGLVEKQAQMPIHHSINVTLPTEDIRRLQELTSRPWSEICAEYNFSPAESFPIHFEQDTDDGCKVFIGIHGNSLGENGSLFVALLSPAGDLVSGDIWAEPFDLFRTGSFVYGRDIYKIHFSPVLEQEIPPPHGDKTDLQIPGFTPEWRSQLIEAAGKAYGTHAIQLHWQPEDALIWAWEETSGGPFDLPPDVYAQLVEDVSTRCQQVESTLDFKLAQIKAQQQGSFELKDVLNLEPSR